MTSPRTGRRVRPAVVAALVALALFAPARRLAAQLISVPLEDRRSLPVTVHGSFGYLLPQNRFDGISGLAWSFGDAFQYRVGADLGFAMGSIGVSGTLATVPIQRGNDPASSGDIQLRQLLATFRSPTPDGFGQVIEFGAGLSQWAGYSGTDVLTDEDAAARNAFAVFISYGFSFPLGRQFSATLMQDYTTAIGSREGLPAGARRSQELYTTRLGLRWRPRGPSR